MHQRPPVYAISSDILYLNQIKIKSLKSPEMPPIII